MDSRVKHGNDTFFSGLGNNRYGKSSCGVTKKEKLVFDLIKKNYSNVQNAEVMNISSRLRKIMFQKFMTSLA